MATETVEFIVRNCGPSGFLPIIRAVNDYTGEERELYRGEHHRPLGSTEDERRYQRQKAFSAAENAWDEETTGNIKEFKNPPTCLEGCP